MTANRNAQDCPRIECIGLTKRLRSGERDLVVLRDASFRIQPGEFVCILGPSGSGKSTLLGLMAGLDRPSEGDVLIDGQSLSGLNEDELAVLRRDGLGFVFQSFQLLENLTAEENIALPLDLGGHEEPRARARELLLEVGLGERGHHYPAQLSGGEQQRVALARAFGSRPNVLFADEPTGNLDTETGERVLELLTQLREREGTTLVLVTHDERIAARAKRRIRLDRGRVASDDGSGAPPAADRDAAAERAAAAESKT